MGFQNKKFKISVPKFIVPLQLTSQFSIFFIILSVLVISSYSDHHESSLITQSNTESPDVIEIFMPKVRPVRDDDYICTSKNIVSRGTVYINKFVPNSDASRAHHMLLFTCDEVEKNLVEQGHWDCAHHYSACRNMRIIYAWAKNAPPTVLPPDVGFRIGPESNISSLVLQVHYAHPMPIGTTDESGFRVHVSTEEPKYLAGMFLMLSSWLIIPSNTEKTHGDMNCLLHANAPIVPFAYRVHTHKLGSVVSGYYVKRGDVKFLPLAKGNPQWPQAFYPIKDNITINPNDLLAARCTFNTTGFNQETHIGSTAGDEMCNLYVMFYTQSRNPEDHFIECADMDFPPVNAAMPKDSDEPLPRNITLEEHAIGAPHAHDDPSSTPHYAIPSMSNTNAEDTKRKSHAKKRPGIQYDDWKDVSPSAENIYREPPARENPVFRPIPSNDDREDRKLTTKSIYQVDSSWPDSSVKYGQPAGISLDLDGNVVFFHRGDRSWGYRTFDNYNRYMERDLGPIATDPVFVIDPNSGKVIHSWGKDRFYLPHGIHVAPNGDTYLTDVALHQVFMFKPGQSEPTLKLGVAFEPGSDDKHFCKPAAVSALSNGDFFVADGYCNSRIVKFDKFGRKLIQWGRSFQPSLYQRLTSTEPPPYAFNIPHALAIAEEKELLCVADRENGRIQCFSTKDGEFKFMIKKPAFGGRLFSVAYSPVDGGTIYAVNHPDGNGRTKVLGFVIPLRTKEIDSVFSPPGRGFGSPHDLAVSQDGSQLYVIEYLPRPYKIYKFTTNSSSSTNKREHSLTSSLTHKSPLSLTNSQVVEGEEESFSNSVLIMAFLTIPILFLICIGSLLRLRSLGCWCCNRRRKETKSFAEFFPPSAGFEKLRMDESESENSDTEIEEFNLPNYRKSLKT